MSEHMENNQPLRMDSGTDSQVPGSEDLGLLATGYDDIMRALLAVVDARSNSDPNLKAQLPDIVNEIKAISDRHLGYAALLVEQQTLPRRSPKSN
jgi:hypothetical protein